MPAVSRISLEKRNEVQLEKIIHLQHALLSIDFHLFAITIFNLEENDTSSKKETFVGNNEPWDHIFRRIILERIGRLEPIFQHHHFPVRQFCILALYLFTNVSEVIQSEKHMKDEIFLLFRFSPP